MATTSQVITSQVVAIIHFSHSSKESNVSPKSPNPLANFVYLCMIQWIFQWEFQDPKMEVLYHIRPYFVGIFPYIGLT
jgi:hypothetical protein